MTEQVLLRKNDKFQEQRKLEEAANLLIRSGQNGLFFQDEMTAYLIRIYPYFGSKISPLRMN